ncbi:hypothetical protein [Photorhabdus africana]|uniref:hypothetical protein n=1 Tax=Photorhabdus africana TaxID=3097554 RepID=UPI002B40F828|nr:hypothetical protein [Photorhabdus sp. CRI-LC]
MKLQYLTSNVLINNIIYQSENNIVTYYFEVLSTEKIISTRVDNKNAIKFIESTKELDDLIMSLMLIDPTVVKKLNKITWDYIENRSISFPFKLI